ncbi:MAG: hypothetical protein G3M78_13990 [Candidatus Nitrohelix vancouverensis]|uniref:Adhesin n=1 Tax=Candidatus Nitrohelix vancouverensis TaxID=2705534 RepID=A0A7T0C4L5_9BACT|nr:MAG: hypothetical protein G3M78_13990 [Candidatus Nitrohelix vancouverensis]
MKKAFILTAGLIFGLAATASADQINNGQTATCVDAQSIEISVETIANASSDKFGYTDNDRGTASLVVWKSSNFTSVPITLGPNDSNHTLVTTDKGLTGIGVRGENGRNKVVLQHQPAFSRGDSIGDISGTVKITNTGTNSVSIKCM